VIRISPNRASCERLLGALLMEFDERLSCGKVYWEGVLGRCIGKVYWEGVSGHECLPFLA
jgi:hypothetical protein